MTKVLRFGAYQFADTGVEFGENFRDLVTRTNRLPGMDGGFDEYGDSRAAAEIGNVRFTLWLKAATASEMQILREALNETANWGKRRLYIETEQGAERWTWARINSIQMNETYRNKPGLNQQVTINWQAADPRWFEIGTEAATWGDGSTWGGGVSWGGTATAQACAGLTTDFTVESAGNTQTEARITISCGAGQTAQNPTVQRLVDGVVVDQVVWTGTLVANDVLEINARRLSVVKNGVDAYSTAFGFDHPAWFRLDPGENDVRVTFANVSDAASVTMRFYDCYR